MAFSLGLAGAGWKHNLLPSGAEINSGFRGKWGEETLNVIKKKRVCTNVFNSHRDRMVPGAMLKKGGNTRAEVQPKRPSDNG